MYGLEQQNGSLVAIGAGSFLAPSFTTSTLAGAVFTVGGGATLLPTDLLSVIVYDGSDIYTLASSSYSVDYGAGTVTIGGGVTQHCDGTRTSCVTVKLVIQRAAVHGATDPQLYNGSEAVQVGQPVLGAGNNIQLDSHGNVVKYAAAQTTRTVSESYYWIPTGNSMTIQLTEDRSLITMSTFTVVVGSTTLPSANYSLVGSTLTITRSGLTTGSPITVTYTGAVLHSRGEPVYSCTGNSCTQLTYAAGTPVLTLGDEPKLHVGGEQAYYSNADPKLIAAPVNRLTITGSTGGLPGDILYSGLGSVTISLGNGNDKVTVNTNAAVTSRLGTGGDGVAATVTAHTGLTTINTGTGFDQVAVQSIEGAVTVNTGTGDDVVDVGSEAGFWPTLGGLTNFAGNANRINAPLTIDGGAGGHDTVMVDDTSDAAHNMGVLSSNQLLGIFGSGGYMNYSNLEELDIHLGNGGNTFTVQSTHGSSSVIATTSIDTGNGVDAVFVDSVSGPTTITTDAGDDTISVGSTTGGALANLALSTLNLINAPLILDAGTGFNTLNTYDTGDTGANTGVLTASTYTGDGMLNGITYANIDALDVNLSNGNDHFTVASTPLGSTLFLYGGDEQAVTNQTNDVIDITSTGGPATVDGGDGNDIIRVNYDQHDEQTFQNGLAGTLTLHGGNGSDEYDIGLSGLPNANGNPQTIINVQDDPTNPQDLGVNQLLIFGTDQPDFFLLRANQEITPATAMVAAFRVVNGQPVLDGVMERVNYDGNINGDLEIFGRAGNDTFVLDDNLAPTTIFGDDGNDTFQIGQVYASPRDGTNPSNGLAPADYFQTTPTTQGFLSNGISAPTTIFGGKGDDSFTVYRNMAELFLYGQEDNDTFTVRAFVKVNPNDPKAPFTNINGGAGADFISYTVDAPVRIDGGDGLDTLVVLGTEFGDDFVVTDKGIFGAGLYITYTGVEKVVVDGEQGNDRFYVASSSPNVEIDLVGGLGSDTFYVGGNGVNTPITVVSNSLNGHSGLIAQLVQSADVNYNNLAAQWVSANVGDNDSPGVMIQQTSPIVVFESATAPTGMAQNRFSVVLTQAPTENVRITLAPTALSEQQALAGGKNIQLNGSDNGVTLLFTTANWFLPQFITVSASNDGLAEGTRFITIQSTVVQGASPDDGGAYDGLAVSSVTAEVVDANSATVVVTPINPGLSAPENGLLVAENSALQSTGGNSIPAQDEYAIVLSKQPTGSVTYQATTDGDTWISVDGGVTWHRGATDPVTVTFTTANWNTMRIVYVKGHDDSIAQGLHFSEISQGITSDPGLLLGLHATDVAQGLAAAVNGDPTGRFSATASGATVTITGPAFTASIANSETSVTSAIDTGASTHAFSGPVTLTLGGTVTAGDVWKVTINGADFGYGARLGDTLPTVATNLASTITRGGLFTATANGSTITITPPDTNPFTVSSSMASSATGTIATSGPQSTPAWAKLVIDVAAAADIEPGDNWVISLNAGQTSQSAVAYTYVAGQNGETPLLAPLDVKVADDEAPGVLVIQPTGSTNVIEPSSFVVLGDGFVSGLIAGGCQVGNTPVTCFTGDFGTSEVNGNAFHSTFDSAQNLDSGAWGVNADPNIANAATIPHITVHDTGNGNANYYKFNVTQSMITSGGGSVSVTLDVDHGYNFGDPIVWLSKVTLYNSSDNVIGQGPGYSNPQTAGAGGSTTWFDDFLSTSVSTPGEYYLSVGSWLLSTGLPVGVTYDLQVSVENHPVAGFVFAPQPVQEDENNNNTTPQSVNDPNNWYTFFNQLIGDGVFGGSIDSQTPYVQINGSGDGSFDMYSFQITQSMLTPPASTLSSGTTAAGPFYSSVSLQLTGTVRAGDVWTLGIGNRSNVKYTAHSGDGLLQVAQGLGALLGSPYTYSATTTSGGQVVLQISNPAGFALTGSGQVLNGLMQLVNSANTITRSTTATQGTGTTPLSFTSATVTLVGPVTAGDTWSITSDGFTANHVATSSDTLTTIASALAGQFTAASLSGLTASSSSGAVTLALAGGLTVAASIAGVNPTGSATVTGTPVAAQLTLASWTTETVTSRPRPCATARRGRSRSADSPARPPRPPAATAIASGIASGLAGDINGHAGYTATASGGTLTIFRATPFSSSAITILPAGSVTPVSGTYDTHLVTIDALTGETGTWTLTLSDGSGTLGSATYSSTSGDDSSAIASHLTSLGSTFHVTRSGAALTITRVDATSTDFTVIVDLHAGCRRHGDDDRGVGRHRADARDGRQLHPDRRRHDDHFRHRHVARRRRDPARGSRPERLHRARVDRRRPDDHVAERLVHRDAPPDERDDAHRLRRDRRGRRRLRLHRPGRSRARRGTPAASRTRSAAASTSPTSSRTSGAS